MNNGTSSFCFRISRQAIFSFVFIGAAQGLAFAETPAENAIEQTPVLAPAAVKAEQGPVTSPETAVPKPVVPQEIPKTAEPAAVDAAAVSADMKAKITEALPVTPPLPEVEAKPVAAVTEAVPAPLTVPAEAKPAEVVAALPAEPKVQSAAVEAPVQPAEEVAEMILPGDMEIPTLGPKPGSTFVRTGLDIAGVGLTSSHKPFITQRPKEPVESRNEFDEGTSQIFWFAFFQEGRTPEERMKRPKFSVEWFAPDGQLVYSGTFRANIAYPEHVKTRLPLATLGMPTVTGRWRVRVMSGEQLVDERHFMVAPVSAS